MRGLGSHSCGPNPEECYELRAHAFRFAFMLTGEKETENLLELSRKDLGSKTIKMSQTYVRDKQERIISKIECNVN